MEVEYRTSSHPQAVYGPFLTCSNVLRYNHTSISCTLPAGAGQGWAVQVTVADLVSDATSLGALLSFDPPRITSAISSYGNSTPPAGTCTETCAGS